MEKPRLYVPVLLLHFCVLLTHISEGTASFGTWDFGASRDVRLNNAANYRNAPPFSNSLQLSDPSLMGYALIDRAEIWNTDFTMHVYIKCTGAYDRFRTIIGSWETGKWLFLFRIDPKDQLQVDLRRNRHNTGSDPRQDMVTVRGGIIEHNRWYAVAFSWQRETGVATIYINGVAVASEGSIHEDRDLMRNSADTFQIGCKADDLSQFFQGNLAKLTIVPNVVPTETLWEWSKSAVNAYACLWSDRCWVKVNFKAPTTWNDCAGGDQYIKRSSLYKYYGLFLGVQLCSPTRYKLFLTDDVTKGFKHIGDGNGGGEDHCELIYQNVGLSEQNARVSNWTLDSPRVEGYYRLFWGQKLSYGAIGTSQRCRFKYGGGRFYCNYPRWYECGVSLPGTRYRVVDYDESFTIAPRSETSPPTPTTTTTTTTTQIPASETFGRWFLAGYFTGNPRKKVSLYNGATYQGSPPFDRALNLTGDAYATIFRAELWNTDFTVHVYIASTGRDNQYRTILGSWEAGKWLFLFRINQENKLQVNLRRNKYNTGSDPRQDMVVVTGGNIEQNRWYFVGFSWQRQTGEVKLYINGTVVASERTAYPDRDLMRNSADTFQIGYKADSHDQFFQGLIADLVVGQYMLLPREYLPWATRLAVPEGPLDVYGCLDTHNSCWVKYNFSSPLNWNDCLGGAKYVKKTTYSGGRYLGVQLCSATRYKLFISGYFGTYYMHIGDINGHGADHCEFLGAGASPDKAWASGQGIFQSPSGQGFYRSNWGDRLEYGQIGATPSWTGKYFPKSYKCGVAVPGSRRVVEYTRPAVSN